MHRSPSPAPPRARHVLRAFVHVALVFAPLAASAQPAPADTPFTCRPDGNQQEMNACALRDYQAADATLNETYQAVMAGLPAAKRKALRQQQRGWLKSRDPRCKAQAKPAEGGSVWPLEYLGCLKTATEARTAALQRWKAKP